MILNSLQQTVKDQADFAATEAWTVLEPSASQVFECHSYRCVVSILRASGKRYKRLAVAPEQKSYPGPLAAWRILETFGFVLPLCEDVTEEWAGALIQELLATNVLLMEIDRKDGSWVFGQRLEGSTVH